MRTNYHTHTTWCDGRDSAEAMVQAAISKGFAVLGFSSHMSFPENSPWALDPGRGLYYVREIRALAEKYRSQIKILCGGEADFIPGVTDPDRSRYAHLGLDYIIGSVHELIAPDGGRVSVDKTPELLAEGIRSHFQGDAQSFVKAYFRQQTEMVERFDFDVVGHPDLVRKFNRKHPYFDESAKWYLELEREFAAVLAKSGKKTEVNTGAISRGWLDDAYPAAPFREMLRSSGVQFILSSDAHSASGIDCAFDRFAAAEAFTEL
ncbi:MAG: histidinol-phosphatase [Kiritimatiellae bacterium]|nr:histidinol-phosphatase [Kiritimatiellia bacterium]